MEPPVGYTPILDENREKLVDAFEDHQTDYLQLANIKRSTAQSIVATYLRSGRLHKLPRGGVYHVKVDKERQTRLQVIIVANPLAVLQQIKWE